jgi:hypothetical protein
MEFVALGKHSYLHCPQCGFPVSSLQGQEKPRLILSQAFAPRFQAPRFSEVMINHFYAHWNRVSRVVGITFRILSARRVQSPPFRPLSRVLHGVWQSFRMRLRYSSLQTFNCPSNARHRTHDLSFAGEPAHLFPSLIRSLTDIAYADFRYWLNRCTMGSSSLHWEPCVSGFATLSSVKSRLAAGGRSCM